MAELTWGCEVKPGRVIEVPLEGMDVTLSQAALDLPGNAAPKRGSHWATLYAQCKDWPKPLAVCTLTEGPGTQHFMLNTSFYVQDRIVTLTSKGNATMHLIGTITDYSEGGDIEDEEDEEDEEAEEAEASSAEESVDDEDEESEAQVAPAPSPASSKKQKPARGKKRGRANSSDSAEAPAAAATAATTEAPPTKQQRRAAAKAARRQQAEAEAAAKQSKSARPVKEVGGAARRDVVNHKSGLKYVDQEVGRGKRPQAGKKVTIRYTGRLAKNGKQFDSGTMSFRLGVGKVIRGMDMGIATMAVGGSRRLFIPPKLGYGARGAGGVIPPNAGLIFDVDLVSTK